MSAIVPKAGPTRQLDRAAEPDEQVTEEQVTDPSSLSRLAMRVLRDLAELRRRWHPRRIDFEDLAVDASGTTRYRLPHHIGGAVRWWPVDWNGASVAALVRHSSSDSKTLVLTSLSAGTVTVRIEEVG